MARVSSWLGNVVERSYPAEDKLLRSKRIGNTFGQSNNKDGGMRQLTLMYFGKDLPVFIPCHRFLRSTEEAPSH
jgi:hypothetical protein